MTEMINDKKCVHCSGRIAIRKPFPKTGCDHLYYPESCLVCSTINVWHERIEQLEADYSSEVQAKELAIEKVIALEKELAKLKEIKGGEK